MEFVIFGVDKTFQLFGEKVFCLLVQLVFVIVFLNRKLNI